MGRGKLNMQLIEKEQSRLTTYQKRKKGLKKKATEFSTLCGVDACMIIYGPKLKGENPTVEIWPEYPGEVRRIINNYKAKLFDARGVRTSDLLDFFTRRKKKVEDDTAKLRKANLEARFPTWDDRLNMFSLDQIKALLATFDANLDVVKRKVMMIRGDQRLMYDSSSWLTGGSDAQSCIDTSKPPQVFFQKNRELEFVTKLRSLSHVKPLDVQVPQYYLSDQALQMLPVDVNPYDNQMMMLMMNGSDLTQFGSRSNPYMPSTPIKIPFCYDPGSTMSENVEFNNHRASPMCLYGPSTQAMPMYRQAMMPGFSSQMHGSRFTDFYHDINIGDEKSTKEL